MKPLKRISLFIAAVNLMVAVIFCSCYRMPAKSAVVNKMETGFLHPPIDAQPGVYWYFMDGNMSRKGMTADLEAMKKAGIGSLVFLEVNVGLPLGPVEFLSEQWQELFKHAESECRRLDIRMTLGIGPGWTGSGGPWVPAKESMQHLVSSSVQVYGPVKNIIILPLPAPKKPFFGEEQFTSELKKQWDKYYEDVAVLAFPTPALNNKLEDIDEKALYYRAPYTSVKNVKQYIPSLPVYADLPKETVIAKHQVVDITDKLSPDGILGWEVPSGNWTIMRFGSRNNGAVTRPAPLAGVGFESDKFDTTALNNHLKNFVGKLLYKIGRIDTTLYGGLKMLHMDSWEMGAQNWTLKFREEFIKRRGYDPLPFYPVYAGSIVESLEISERFLWDVRLTSQELVIDYHANHVKRYSHNNGLGLSIEPYDMNPIADLELGAVADIPMAEFWSKGFGFNSSFSCAEATSIAHVNGQPVVQSEAFTAYLDGWKQYPASMKEQGDWAFATGINKFFYHTFQHQSLGENLRPGMTMGPYGVHWDRNQTWWPMVKAYHQYISRCQFMLQQGRTVADILYLTPEGSPHVFLPPASAMTEDEILPDRRGHNFDGCSPGQLYKATVKDNQIVFPGGASYRVLVLPFFKTMTPALLQKIQSLILDGAIVIGEPPVKSPGLSGFPVCDFKVQSLASEIWGGQLPPAIQTQINYGKGKIIWGGEFDAKKTKELYPSYFATAKLLETMGIAEDFKADIPVRYTHRTTNDFDIYFVSNSTNKSIKGKCTFNLHGDNNSPELWDAVTGEIRKLPEFTILGNQLSIPLQFDCFQSFFIVFKNKPEAILNGWKNFGEITGTTKLTGSWEVSFDTIWGGPEKARFDSLSDWSVNQDKRIKFYSGIAVYRKIFNFIESTNADKNTRFYIDLGEVKNLAKVKLNGEDAGIIWTNPWRVDITRLLRKKRNVLEIEVANLWPNRLIGDEQLPDDGIKDEKWPDWLLADRKRTSGRYTFTTYKHYTKDASLLKSGLLGPVTIQKESF
jgi:alpha-L-rhamnosidase